MNENYAKQFPFHQAVIDGDIDKFLELVSKRKDKDSISPFDNYGRTILHIAAENNYFKLLTLGLESCEIDPRITSYGNTQKIVQTRAPIFHAVINDAVECIALLSRAGGFKDLFDCLGNSPLHAAVENNAVLGVTACLNIDADIDAQNKAGDTPLHIAIANSNLLLVRELLVRGANVHIKNNFGMCPLQIGAGRTTRNSNDGAMKMLILKSVSSVKPVKSVKPFKSFK